MQVLINLIKDLNLGKIYFKNGFAEGMEYIN